MESTAPDIPNFRSNLTVTFGVFLFVFLLVRSIKTTTGRKEDTIVDFVYELLPSSYRKRQGNGYSS